MSCVVHFRLDLTHVPSFLNEPEPAIQFIFHAGAGLNSNGNT